MIPSKVLIMAPLPPQRCGVSLHAFNLGKYLAGKGISPVGLTYGECGRGSAFKKARFKVYHLPTFFRPDRVPFVRAVLYVFFGVFLGFFVILKERIRLIHAHGAIPQGLLACILGRITGVPYVYTAHGAELILHLERGRFFHGLIERVICHAGAATSVCRKNREFLSRFNRRSFVVPNGIDDAFVERFSGRNRRTGAGKPAMDILFVGHINPYKGVDLLIRAAEELAKSGSIDFRMKLVGGGHPPAVRKYVQETRSRNLDGKVIFCGIREDVAEMMTAADLFVLPSRIEGLPTALLEAMAVGLPVVAAAVGGIPDVVVHEKNGLLVPPGDPAALAAAVRKLAADKELGRRLAEEGMKTVHSFRWSVVGDAYLDIYKTVAGDWT